MQKAEQSGINLELTIGSIDLDSDKTIDFVIEAMAKNRGRYKRTREECLQDIALRLPNRDAPEVHVTDADRDRYGKRAAAYVRKVFPDLFEEGHELQQRADEAAEAIREWSAEIVEHVLRLADLLPSKGTTRKLERVASMVQKTLDVLDPTLDPLPPVFELTSGESGSTVTAYLPCPLPISPANKRRMRRPGGLQQDP